MLNKESLNTLLVAFILCLVCSVMVSTIAVALKDKQQANKALDRNKNILAAAGLYNTGEHSNADVDRLFSQFTVRLVNFASGKYATDAELAEYGIDAQSYDQRAAAKDPSLSEELMDDPAGISRRANFAKVYVLEENSEMQLIVLPVHGYGLWGTLYGYLVLQGNANDIVGLAFYEHKETPGLGAKVDTDSWKSQWPGKVAYDAAGDVAVKVMKGKATKDNEIDGLSGATLTTRGVDNLINFWLGEAGFSGFLSNLRVGEA